MNLQKNIYKLTPKTTKVVRLPEPVNRQILIENMEHFVKLNF